MDFVGIVKKFAASLGVDVRRYRHDNTEAGQLRMLFESYGVTTVFDVGANEGQYAMAVRQAGFSGRIVSFEPLSSAYGILSANAERDGKWIVADRCAIGSENGEARINVAGNSASSSLLSMLDRHASAAPESRYVSTELVPLRTLDSLAHQYLDEKSRPFIKIDTQGYENQVLDGASNFLDRAIGVQLELSTVSLYAGQSLYDQIIGRMTGAGFSIRAIWPGFRDRMTGELLQFDAAFFRDSTSTPMRRP